MITKTTAATRIAAMTTDHGHLQKRQTNKIGNGFKSPGNAYYLVDIIYPFAASYRPGWVGVGQLGFYLSAVLTLSFYVRKTISPKTWRKLHYLTFLTYGMVVVHSLASGSDTSALPVQIMYVGSGAAIAFLIYYRLFTVGQKRSR
jgi:predicted ferric reductase